MPIDAMLACVEPFTAVRPDEIERLAAAVSVSKRSAGTVMVREGHVSDGLYIVLRGRVHQTRTVDGGRDLILASLGPGEVLGEGCAFGGLPASTNSTTALPTEIARIPADVIAEHVRREPSTVQALMRIMAAKLQDVESVASGLALCDVEQRLRQTLAKLARRQGRPAPHGEGKWIIAPMPTQSELARMVGSCRETVSRTLSAMARNGLLSSSGRRMVLDGTIVDA